MSIKIGDNTIGGSPVVENTTGNSYTKTMSQASITNELENKADKNLVNTGFITNCITEIPQDIKLELNNGTLTLKAGSKVYVPNGFESDGTTKKFDTVIITDDLTSTFDNTLPKMLFVKTNGQQIRHCNRNTQQVSGTSASISWGYWYDTTNNIIKFTNDGSTWQTTLNISLPVGLATGTDGSVTSIDQIFNGFGYIGSTIFALPGVKGLIPNGRNNNGTLKNREATTDIIRMRMLGGTGDYTFLIALDGGDFDYVESSKYVESSDKQVSPIRRWFDTKNNIMVNLENGKKISLLKAVTATLSNGIISNFQPKTAFHALDYNDSSYISQCAMPSNKYIDLTWGASGTSYIAPANGWFYARARSKGTTKPVYIVLYNSSSTITGYSSLYLPSTSAQYTVHAYIPVGRGQTVTLSYDLASTVDNNVIRFVYAEGEI